MLRHAIPDIDLRKALTDRGLECHLLVADSQQGESFPALLCAEIQDLTFAAYGRVLTEEHLRYETWGVTLREADAPHPVVACATLSFRMDLPSCFHTHFEAVRPERQRTGLGRLLYDCLVLWARFLAINDPIALDGVARSGGDYCLVSTIDRHPHGDDDEDHEPIQSPAHDDEPIPSPTAVPAQPADHAHALGPGAFLKRLGFVRALHDFGQSPRREIAFQRDFRIPLFPLVDDF